MPQILVETTGLANPAPVTATFTQNPVVANHFRVDGIVCLVDCKVCACAFPPSRLARLLHVYTLTPTPAHPARVSPPPRERLRMPARPARLAVAHSPSPLPSQPLVMFTVHS